MKKLLLYFSLFCCLSCNYKKPQADQSANNRYLTETKAFISDVYREQLKDTTFIITNEPVSIDTTEIIKSDAFSTTELKEIRLAIKNPPIKDWQKVLTTNKKYIRSDTVARIFDKPAKGYTDGWDYVYKTMGYKKLASVSAPIFLRNYTYCLFYAGYSCGFLCGYGELVLFKKVKGKWEQARTFSSWIS